VHSLSGRASWSGKPYCRRNHSSTGMYQFSGETSLQSPPSELPTSRLCRLTSAQCPAQPLTSLLDCLPTAPWTHQYRLTCQPSKARALMDQTLPMLEGHLVLAMCVLTCSSTILFPKNVLRGQIRSLNSYDGKTSFIWGARSTLVGAPNSWCSGMPVYCAG
jgi:hypothetical protein